MAQTDGRSQRGIPVALIVVAAVLLAVRLVSYLVLESPLR